MQMCIQFKEWEPHLIQAALLPMVRPRARSSRSTQPPPLKVRTRPYHGMLHAMENHQKSGDLYQVVVISLSTLQPRALPPAKLPFRPSETHTKLSFSPT